MPPRRGGTPSRGGTPGRGSTPSRGGTPSRGQPTLVGVGQHGAPPRSGAPQIAAHVNTVGVRRPNYGTGGVASEIYVNAFSVTIPDGHVYHYDVAITPDNLPSRRNMELFKKLHTEVAKGTVFKDVIPVYDGKKNAYTMKHLPLNDDTHTFDIVVGAATPDRPPKIIKLKLTLARVINTQILHSFINGQQSIDNDVHTSIAAFNVAIRMTPNQEYTFNTRSFFVPKDSRAVGKGLELWRGYFQSIRPTFGRMYVNLDMATGVMYRSGPLVETCMQFLGRPTNNASRELANLNDRDRIRLQRFLSNVRFRTNYGTPRDFSIKKLTQVGADKVTFKNKEGRVVTVARYFNQILNRPLKLPNIPCVEIGGGAAIPMELCDILPGQILRKQIPQETMSDVVDFSKKTPQDRLAIIRSGFEVLKYTTSQYVAEFGLKVSQQPMVVKARVIPAPTLKYHRASRQPTIQPQDGAWNMRDKRFYLPMSIGVWMVVVFDTRFREENANEAVQGFVASAKTVGINITNPTPPVFYGNPQRSVHDVLVQHGQTVNRDFGAFPHFVLVILPDNGNEIYAAVKHFGDVVTGTATQCVKASKARRANAQYWANVMLKVNAKLGGINSVLDNSLLNDPAKPTIIMGADSVHPPPGASDRPSFGALVSSVDSTTAKYVSSIRVQTGRQELIEDLEAMCVHGLERYRSYQTSQENQRKPLARLIFYRDGVSEGQFEQVLAEELPKIKSACKSVPGCADAKITLIVVGKRHHIRMFPKDGPRDRSGNCKAGTTVDDGIGHPTEHDYYLLSHGGLLGTSRPSHYSVIYDENNMSADAMQSISFSLCHVYARATRSVSIPAPVYYADIVCARAKIHFPPNSNFDLSDLASNTTAQSGNAAYLEGFRAAFRPTHANQANRMYFM